MEAAQVVVLCDQSLSDAARIIALRLSEMGDDWHELASDDFARMVGGYPKQETVAKHLRQLEVAGYVDRKRGGKGHSDRFRFNFRPIKKPGSKVLDPENNPGLNGLDPENTSGLKPLVVGVDDVVYPPMSPLRGKLDERAAGVIETNSNLLKGCRGSMRDYLTEHVPPTRQYAYAQSVVGWLNDINPAVWVLPDGGRLPATDRTRLLAAAFNDLAASDEKMMKRPVGDVANLQTKLNILLRKRSYGQRDNTRGTGTEGGRTPGSDQSARRRRDWTD